MPQVIVSMTSYGKNTYRLAPKAIRSLLNQTVKPDRVILWLGYGSRVNIYLRILKLKGLEIRFCDDIGPSTKILPALENFPLDTIITADDDIIYPSDWLVRLLEAHRRFPRRIIAHRAHAIKLNDKQSVVASYNKWEKCINPKSEAWSSKQWNLFPTGVGGVLYPAGSLPKRALDLAELALLTPKNDDIWLWAMANINKAYFKGMPPYVVLRDGYSKDLNFVNPYREQKSLGTLGGSNVLSGGNDKQMMNVIKAIPELKDTLAKMV